MTNFDFLTSDSQFNSFSSVAVSAEKILHIDPSAAVINCRRAMEFAVKWMYSVDKDFFAAAKAEYRKRRDLVVDRLKKIPGVVVQEPMGAFYLMAGLPVDDADKFQHWLLQEFDDNGDTVMFAPGAPFYETPGKGINEVRIAYVLELKKLERAMELLAKGIAKYQKEMM